MANAESGNTVSTHGNATQAVQYNLENADKVQSLNGDVNAATEAHGGPVEHSIEPTALMMNATAWVSLAMLVFLGILVWKKVPAVIGAALDKKISAIRTQLDEASTLRKEADAMRVAAEEEAADLISAAKVEAEALIIRRQKMAEDKIGAAERGAIADVRARAAAAATAAATALVRETHDAKADKGLVDDVISKLTH